MCGDHQGRLHIETMLTPSHYLFVDILSPLASQGQTTFLLAVLRHPLERRRNWNGWDFTSCVHVWI